MSVKVKRGLGLLVVAVLAWLATIALLQAPASVPTFLALAVTGIATLGALLGGLVLLAWGLLRD